VHDPDRRSLLRALAWLQQAGLAILAVATVIAIGQEVAVIWQQRSVRVADLLLLFIYLEVFAMVSAYLQSGHMPVRMPLYIAMVAMARYLVLDVKALENWRVLAVSGGILLLACAVLLIRYGHVRFPYAERGAAAGEDGCGGRP